MMQSWTVLLGLLFPWIWIDNTYGFVYIIFMGTAGKYPPNFLFPCYLRDFPGDVLTVLPVLRYGFSETFLQKPDLLR